MSVYFVKQKAAYEVAACLVGSDMCIRASPETVDAPPCPQHVHFLAMLVNAGGAVGGLELLLGRL